MKSPVVWIVVAIGLVIVIGILFGGIALREAVGGQAARQAGRRRSHRQSDP
jgi:phosphate/sulfate permease